MSLTSSIPQSPAHVDHRDHDTGRGVGAGAISVEHAGSHSSLVDDRRDRDRDPSASPRSFDSTSTGSMTLFQVHPKRRQQMLCSFTVAHSIGEVTVSPRAVTSPPPLCTFLARTLSAVDVFADCGCGVACHGAVGGGERERCRHLPPPRCTFLACTLSAVDVFAVCGCSVACYGGVGGGERERCHHPCALPSGHATC